MKNTVKSDSENKYNNDNISDIDSSLERYKKR